MERVLCHHPLASVLALLSLIAAAILPMGSVASAATACPSGGEGNNCFLVISAPDSVAIGPSFTVQVGLWVFGEPNHPIRRSDSCSRVAVSLDLWYDNGDGSVIIGSFSANARRGTARFSVSVPLGSQSGKHYFWHAYVNSDGACGFNDADYPVDTDFTAVFLAPGQPIAPCPDTGVCVQTTNNDQGGGSAATLSADTGSFPSAFFEQYDGNGCGAPTDPIYGVLNFSYVGTSEKLIVFALAPYLITQGIGHYGVCWESPNPFTVAGGGAAVFNSTTNLYVGYLPKCGDDGEEEDEDEGVSQPCVLFKKSTEDNGGFFGVLAPSSDPKGYVGTP